MNGAIIATMCHLPLPECVFVSLGVHPACLLLFQVHLRSLTHNYQNVIIKIRLGARMFTGNINGLARNVMQYHRVMIMRT